MPYSFMPRALAAIALLLLCLVAGVIGGIDFAPDVADPRSRRSAPAPRADQRGHRLYPGGQRLRHHRRRPCHGGVAGVARPALEGDPAGGTVIAERIIIDGMKLLVGRPRPAFDLHPVVTNARAFRAVTPATAWPSSCRSRWSRCRGERVRRSSSRSREPAGRKHPSPTSASTGPATSSAAGRSARRLRSLSARSPTRGLKTAQ